MFTKWIFLLQIFWKTLPLFLWKFTNIGLFITILKNPTLLSPHKEILKSSQVITIKSAQFIINQSNILATIPFKREDVYWFICFWFSSIIRSSKILMVHVYIFIVSIGKMFSSSCIRTFSFFYLTNICINLMIFLLTSIWSNLFIDCSKEDIRDGKIYFRKICLLLLYILCFIKTVWNETRHRKGKHWMFLTTLLGWPDLKKKFCHFFSYKLTPLFRTQFEDD